jgi:hypothetical protein
LGLSYAARGLDYVDKTGGKKEKRKGKGGKKEKKGIKKGIRN